MRSLNSLSLLALLALPGCGSGTPTGPDSDPYEIEVRFLGDAPTAAVQQAFSLASTRIESVVTGGVDPIGLPSGFNLEVCHAAFAGHPDVPTAPVQGLVIYVLVEAIDGAGSVLGSAGPCLVREEDNSKPALGVMRLDEEDLAAMSAQRLGQLVLHEMLHVVGFGTIWADNDLLDSTDVNDARFVGALGRAACAEQNGGVTTCATTVPVHSADGEGSAYAHWRESTFGSELMTPFLNVGAAPLSAMTIRSLADMGYEVNAAGADAFAIASLRDAAIVADERAVELPAPTRPRYRLKPDGALVPFRGQY